MENHYSLYDIQPGERTTVTGLKAKGAMRRRLQDIGLVKDTTVECIGRSPSGDPKAFLIRGAVIAIRSEDCKTVLVKPIGAQ